MTITEFPKSAAARLEILKAILRHADTGTMTTPEVVQVCESALSDCTVDEIITALRLVADEHIAEAVSLEQCSG